MSLKGRSVISGQVAPCSIDHIQFPISVPQWLRLCLASFPRYHALLVKNCELFIPLARSRQSQSVFCRTLEIRQQYNCKWTSLFRIFDIPLPSGMEVRFVKNMPEKVVKVGFLSLVYLRRHVRKPEEHIRNRRHLVDKFRLSRMPFDFERPQTISQAVARTAGRTALQHLCGSHDVIGHVTIWYPIGHFLLVVLWNQVEFPRYSTSNVTQWLTWPWNNL